MSARTVNKIIIHCTDSPDNRDFDIANVSEWHKARGFLPSLYTGLYCGYHYLIKRDGTIQVGRYEVEQGAHCKGQNKDSIGICWVGSQSITHQQYDALCNLTCSVLTKYGLEPKQVFGHHEFNSGKTCPNLNMDKFRDDIEIIYSKGD